MIGMVITAAKEVCGMTTRDVTNPWTLGKEEEIERRKERIKVAVRRRNERMQEIVVRRRLWPRKEDVAREVELARMRTEVRKARKDMKGYFRELERD